MRTQSTLRRPQSTLMRAQSTLRRPHVQMRVEARSDKCFASPSRSCMRLSCSRTHRRALARAHARARATDGVAESRQGVPAGK
eukprot:6186910-Pleurochrysis_carterae.AAC.1